MKNLNCHISYYRIAVLLAILPGVFLLSSIDAAAGGYGFSSFPGNGYYYYYDDDDEDEDEDDDDDDDDDEYYYDDYEDKDTSADKFKDDVGWKEENGIWHYYDENNSIVKNKWIKRNNKIYYLDENGARLTGLSTIKDGLYYFDEKGRLLTGWQSINENRYYFSEEYGLGIKGKAVTGFKFIGGKRYHFNKDGVMDTGEVTLESGVYYFKENGVQRVGWVDVDNGLKRYYYTESDDGKKYGQMVRDTTYKGHYFAQNGVTGKTIDYCKKVLDEVGWNLRAAYNWSAGLSYSGRTTYLENWGSSRLANQGFENHTGNCYVMAATFYELAQCLGYDAHQIAGAVPSRRGGLANHSWVEIVEDGEVWIYDPNCTMETHVDRFHFKYGTPGTWRYTNYHRMN